jgi:hypothetical protein
MNQALDFPRLLEKYFDDIKHIETESHWFFAAYAVVLAGVLTFLSREDGQSDFVFAWAVVLLLSFMGWLHSLPATKILYKLQNETVGLVRLWQESLTPKSDDFRLSEHWLWPLLRDGGQREHWWSDLVVDLFKMRKRSPPHFSSIGVWVYTFGFLVSLGLVVRNAAFW